MKKYLSFVLLWMLFLSACTPSVTPTAAPVPTTRPITPPSTQAPAPAKQTEVTWYTRVNEAEQKWEIETVIPNFQRAYPGIKINLVAVPAADYDRRLQAMVTSGAGPDIWSHWGTNGFQDYVKRGWVADLTAYIENEKFDLSDFLPEVLDIYKVDGKLMGLPFVSTGSFIFYNKDLFDKAAVKYPTTDWDDKSWTWAAFLDKCKALTSIKGDPKTDAYGCNLDLHPNEAYAWLWGVDIFPDSAYKTGFADKSNLADPKVSAAYQARQDLIWKNKYMPDPDTTNANSFKDGSIAMNLTTGQGWQNFSDIKNFKWAVAALPYGGDGRRDVTFTDPWMMSSKTAHPQEAWTFMKYLASPQIQESWLKLVNTPPVRKSLLEKWAVQFPNMGAEEVKQVFLGALKYGRETPGHMLARYELLEPNHQLCPCPGLCRPGESRRGHSGRGHGIGCGPGQDSK